MEKENERVLAYSMAKVIPHEDLVEVSGGMTWSRTTTVGPSGSDIKSADAHVDVTIDF
jgi:hypothetical protein